MLLQRCLSDSITFALKLGEAGLEVKDVTCDALSSLFDRRLNLFGIVVVFLQVELETWGILVQFVDNPLVGLILFEKIFFKFGDRLTAVGARRIVDRTIKLELLKVSSQVAWAIPRNSVDRKRVGCGVILEFLVNVLGQHFLTRVTILSEGPRSSLKSAAS